METLEMLQQLPAEEAEDGLCTMTCTYSCWSTNLSPEPCQATGFFT